MNNQTSTGNNTISANARRFSSVGRVAASQHRPKSELSLALKNPEIHTYLHDLIRKSARETRAIDLINDLSVWKTFTLGDMTTVEIACLLGKAGLDSYADWADVYNLPKKQFQVELIRVPVLVFGRAFISGGSQYRDAVRIAAMASLKPCNQEVCARLLNLEDIDERNVLATDPNWVAPGRYHYSVIELERKAKRLLFRNQVFCSSATFVEASKTYLCKESIIFQRLAKDQG